MQKFELIDQVAAATGLPKKTVRAVFDAADDAVRKAVFNGDEVRLFGLGKISVSPRGPRVASGFKKGNRIPIPPRNVVKFTPSVGLDAAANPPKSLCA